jgi:hypothetical protein
VGVYILDSNFFIQAHRATYPLDVAVGFWNKVKELADAGEIISIDKVRDELYDKNDDLEAWCRTNLPEYFFKSTSEADVLNCYASISGWAISRSGHYKQGAINEFLDADEADAFIISYAMVDIENRRITTQEVSDTRIKKKIKIPEPCENFGVSYVNTMEMFRRLGVKF